MCADVVSYDTQHLQQKDDEDLEEDDIRLQTELKHLIEEELDGTQFIEQCENLSDYHDEVVCNSNADQNPVPSSRSHEDTTSIAAAGNISELEEAIHHFGTEMSASEEEERRPRDMCFHTDEMSPHIQQSNHCSTLPAFQSYYTPINQGFNGALYNEYLSTNRRMHNSTQSPITLDEYSVPDQILNSGFIEESHPWRYPFARDPPPQPSYSTPDLCRRPDSPQTYSCHTPRTVGLSTSGEMFASTARPLFSPPPFSPPSDDDASSVLLSPAPSQMAGGDLQGPPALFSVGNGHLEAKAAVAEQQRERLIFEARGKQLEDAQQQIHFLKDERVKSEQLNKHKEILARAEIETLSRELERSEAARTTAESKIAELAEATARQEKENAILSQKKLELEERLAEVETTNASLSAELVQLSSGASLSLAKQRETNLADCLARRHAMAEDVLRENLEIAQRRIIDKEDEVTALRRDLESERLRVQGVTVQHAEVVEKLERTLKASQDRCHELSSSSLCAEVQELRHRIQEIVTSKKITDDVNEILQEELRDVREQLAIYEQSLGISNGDFNIEHEEQELEEANPAHAPPPVTPRNHLPLFQGESGNVLSTIIAKPSESLRRRRRSCQSVSFAPQANNNFNIDLARPQRPSSASAPLCSTRNQDLGAGASASDDEIVSTTPSRRSALGPVSGVSCACTLGSPFGGSHTKTPHASLQRDLKQTLACYGAKSRQVTRLHEKLFSTRCDLHRALTERDRAEAARADLQLRVCSLEKELNLRGDVHKAGPRETALSGQIERLQVDYSRLETELQTTRSRLQDALAAEARAVAAERATRERLEASGAEREATVERVRASCEAHYTAARRRLEAELSAEHERLLQQAKQETLAVREELNAYRSELDNLNRLYQEARAATATAVEMTLNEAMKERENERIRFWREELPRQIDQARSSWLAESAAHAAVDSERIRTACEAEFNARVATLRRSHLAEVDRLRRQESSKPTRERGVQCLPAFVRSASLPLLSRLLPSGLLSRLVASLLDVSILFPVEQALRVILEKLAKALVQRVSRGTSKALAEAIRGFSAFEEYRIKLQDAESSTGGEEDEEEPAVQELLTMLRESISLSKPLEVEIIREMVSGCVPQTPETSALSEATLSKLKASMLTYIEACQERCARALQTNLVRVHRRACRELCSRLRVALVQAVGGETPSRPPAPSAVRTQSTNPMRLSSPSLETLLHIIDAACSSTEAAFSDVSRQGRPLFSPPTADSTAAPSAARTSVEAHRAQTTETPHKKASSNLEPQDGTTDIIKSILNPSESKSLSRLKNLSTAKSKPTVTQSLQVTRKTSALSGDVSGSSGINGTQIPVPKPRTSTSSVVRTSAAPSQ